MLALGISLQSMTCDTKYPRSARCTAHIMCKGTTWHSFPEYASAKTRPVQDLPQVKSCVWFVHCIFVVFHLPLMSIWPSRGALMKPSVRWLQFLGPKRHWPNPLKLDHPMLPD